MSARAGGQEWGWGLRAGEGRRRVPAPPGPGGLSGRSRGSLGAVPGVSRGGPGGLGAVPGGSGRSRGSLGAVPGGSGRSRGSLGAVPGVAGAALARPGPRKEAAGRGPGAAGEVSPRDRPGRRRRRPQTSSSSSSSSSSWCCCWFCAAAAPAPRPPPRHAPGLLKGTRERRDAEHQVRGGGRRGGGQDLPAHLLHHQRLPQGVHPHRVRQLQRPEHGGRQDYKPKPVGHGRPGGVRPPADAFLPPDQRLHHLLLHRQPALLRERQAQVVPRGVPPLPQRAHPPRGHQEGSEEQPRDHEAAQGAEPGAHHHPAGHQPLQADPRRQVPGVLGAQPGGHQGCVHRGREGRAQPRPSQAQEALCALVTGPVRDDPAPPRAPHTCCPPPPSPSSVGPRAPA